MQAVQAFLLAPQTPRQLGAQHAQRKRHQRGVALPGWGQGKRTGSGETMHGATPLKWSAARITSGRPPLLKGKQQSNGTSMRTTATIPQPCNCTHLCTAAQEGGVLQRPQFGHLCCRILRHAQLEQGKDGPGAHSQRGGCVGGGRGTSPLHDLAPAALQGREQWREWQQVGVVGERGGKQRRRRRRRRRRSAASRVVITCIARACRPSTPSGTVPVRSSGGGAPQGSWGERGCSGWAMARAQSHWQRLQTTSISFGARGGLDRHPRPCISRNATPASLPLFGRVCGVGNGDQTLATESPQLPSSP